MSLTRFGKPNPTFEPAPRRDATPGVGGVLLGPDTIRLARPTGTSATEWQRADDDRKLALAPESDRKRLVKEEGSLTAAEATHTAAEGAVERAKAALIEARVEGHDHRKAAQEHEKAERVLANAKRSLTIQREVTETLRARLVQRVRADLERVARVKLEAAHAQYDASLAELGRTAAHVQAMREARAAEAAAAAELASAVGTVPALRGGEREDHATGSGFVTIGATIEDVALVVRNGGDPITLDGGAIYGHLRRETGR